MGDVTMGFCCDCLGGTEENHCNCYCDNCAPKEDLGPNAPCCWAVQIAGEWKYLSQEAAGTGTGSYENICRWSTPYCDCDHDEVGLGTGTVVEGEIYFEIHESHMLLSICGEEFSEGLGEAPDCCSPITVGAYTLYPTYLACCSQGPECVQLTIAGVTNLCGCAACENINSTFSLGYAGGAGYTGTLCKTGNLYDKCESVGLTRGWNVASVSFQQGSYGCSGGNITASIKCFEGGVYSGTVSWTGTVEAGATSAVLAYASGGTEDKCDFSVSTATVAFGPNCYPCGDTANCDAPPACNCKDGASPSYWEVTIPDGYTSGGPGVEQTFLVPVSDPACPMGYITGNLVRTAPNCNSGPSRIAVIDTWQGIILYYGVYSMRFQLTSAAFTTFVQGYCEGDQSGNYDCVTLYGAELEVPYAFGSNPCGWDGSALRIRTIP